MYEFEMFEDFAPMPLQGKGRSKASSSKQIEASRKQKEVAANKEMNGLYKRKEVSIIVDNQISDLDLSPLLNETFFRQGMDVLRTDDTRQIYMYSEKMFPGLCLWVHRSFSKGGHCKLGGTGSRVLPYFTLIMSAQRFISLATSAASDMTIEYPELTRTIQQCRREFCALHSVHGLVGEIITCSIIIHDLDKEVVSKQLAVRTSQTLFPPVSIMNYMP